MARLELNNHWSCCKSIFSQTQFVMHFVGLIISCIFLSFQQVMSTSKNSNDPKKASLSHLINKPKPKNIHKRQDENEPDEQTKQLRQIRKHFGSKSDNKKQTLYREPLKEMLPQAPNCMKTKSSFIRHPAETFDVLCDSEKNDFREVLEIKTRSYNSRGHNTQALLDGKPTRDSLSKRIITSNVPAVDISQSSLIDLPIQKNITNDPQIKNKKETNNKNKEDHLTEKTLHRDINSPSLKTDKKESAEVDETFSEGVQRSSFLEISPFPEAFLDDSGEFDSLGHLNSDSDLSIPLYDSSLTLSPPINYEEKFHTAFPNPRGKSIVEKLGFEKSESF
ncbi:hypothetical protein BY458DRAFT_61111 [Sporodiniella umbellata]|nr:hypothetical protein BY458DRAFT_61111 [Sporodiniella umbellata]